MRPVPDTLYWGSAINTTANTVQVRSSADSTWRRVVLTETNANTGIFQASIKLLTDADGNSDFDNRVDDDDGDTPMVLLPLLRVNDSGRVTMRYDDGGTRRTKSIDVESTAPVLSNFSPAHNASGVWTAGPICRRTSPTATPAWSSPRSSWFATLESDDSGMPVKSANNEPDKGGPALGERG